MKAHARLGVTVGAFALCLYVLPALGADVSSRKDPLAELEMVTAKFETLTAFLANLPAQREYEKKLIEYYGRDKFPCEPFPEVLGQVKRWLNNAPELAARLWERKVTTAREFSWTEGGKPERYRFVATQRLFHGLWEDLSRGGCPATECVPPGIARPGRWAAALDGAEVVHVERNGKFTGASMLVSTVKQGFKKYRMVSHTSDPVFDVHGEIASARLGKISATLIDQWATLASGDLPIASAMTGSVKRLPGGAAVGKTNEFAFADPIANRLSLVLPQRCERGDMSLALGGGASSGGAGGAAGVPGSIAPSPAAANPAAAQAALNDIVMNLSPGGKATPSSPQDVEVFLGNALKNQKSPEMRAKAALGLDILGQMRSVDPGRMMRAPSSINASSAPIPQPEQNGAFSPSTNGLLVQALEDPSPAVRGAAGVALSGGGASVSGDTAAKLGRAIGDAQRTAGSSINVATNSGGSGSSNSSSPSAPFASPEAIKERAFKEMLKQGLEMEPKAYKDMWKEAANPANAEQQRDRTKEIAANYLRLSTWDGALTGIQALQESLRENPSLLYPVLKEIKSQFAQACLECRNGTQSERPKK